MRITFEIRRRHLAMIPKLAAAVALVLTIGVDRGLRGVLLVLVTYVGSAFLLAFVDELGQAFVRWRAQRRLDRQIESTISRHPVGISRPRHARARRLFRFPSSKGAVAA